MNLFAPGLREASRIFGRQLRRLKLLIARRKLARAETELGLLGWQQADFEGEALPHVEQLTDFERTQARLTNESAALALAIRQLQEQRAGERRQYDEARARLEAERAKVAGPFEEAARQLAVRQRSPEKIAERQPALERELEEVSRLCNELLAVEPQTAVIRHEVSRLRERMTAIPNEKADLCKWQQQAVHEIQALEESVARGRLTVAAADERLRAQRAEFEAADGARAKEIADRVREKVTVERESDALEKAKSNPYRKIGQLLADSGIAPMNQPHALTAVLHGRVEITRIATAIGTSLLASGSEEPAALRKSWLALAALAIVVLLVVWCVWH